MGIITLSLLLAAQDPSDAIYDEGRINTFRITIDPGAWNLICNDGDGQGGGGVNTVWHRADVQWEGPSGTETIVGVGVRRSGEGTASMDMPKPGLRLSFNEFEFANPPGPNTPGRKWRGVNRIKLDSMIGNTDQAMMRDRVAYGIFRQIGAPASRFSHGRLYVNGAFKGLYGVEEPVRKDWLRYRWGEEDGNLFNARPKGQGGTQKYRWRGSDPGSYVPAPWEEENNYPGGNYADLVELMNIINNTSGDTLRTRLDGHAYLDGLYRHLAMTIAIGDGDDITAWWGIGIEGVNNHYWYHRLSTGKMEILKWDPGASQGLYDQSNGFAKGESPIWHGVQNTRMTSWIPNDPTATAAYKSRLLQIVNGPFQSVHARIDSIYAQIRSHAYEEPLKGVHSGDPNGFSDAEFDAAKDWLKDWYTRRGAYLRAQLGVNDAAFVSQTVPAAMTAGQAYPVSVRMRNTGSTTWTTSSYALGSRNPTDNTTWDADGRVAPGANVAPNGETTFSWTVTAPSTAGTYNFQWQMRQSGVEWFGATTPNVAVVVSAAPPPPPTTVNDADFVSQSVPATVTPGQTFSVSVTMRNAGTSTWTDAATYHLRSQNPAMNTTWGADRATLAAGDSIAPSQQKTFTWTATAPSTPGTYNFQWQMRQSSAGQWFGDLSANVAIVVATAPPPPPISTNDAEFVSQSVPAAMTTGQTYSVTVRMKNTGTTTWTDAATHHLRSQNPPQNFTWGVDRASLASGDAIAPGQDKIFAWTVTAPATPGTYAFQWQMRQSTISEWFGDLTPNVAVVVGAPAPPPPAGTNAAEFVSQAVPAVMTAGQDASVTVTMRNSGTTTWRESTSHRLSSRGPRDNTTWGLNRVYLAPGDAIAPGQSHTFTFDVTAPSVPGTYSQQWSMVQEGVDWFDQVTPAVSVSVVAAPAPAPPPASARGGNNGNGDHAINDKCSGSIAGSTGRMSALAALALLALRRRQAPK